MTLETCPQCSNQIGPPLRSGRQVCMKCGWSDRPRNSDENPATPIDPDEIEWHTVCDESDRVVSSLLIHTSLIFYPTGASLLIPIIILSSSDTKDWVVRSNAKEVLNLQITLYLCMSVLVFLLILTEASVLIIPLSIIFFLIFIFPVFGIIAIIQCCRNPNLPFIYPFILRILK